jgi:hypothetical protein
MSVPHYVPPSASNQGLNVEKLFQSIAEPKQHRAYNREDGIHA